MGDIFDRLGRLAKAEFNHFREQAKVAFEKNPPGQHDDEADDEADEGQRDEDGVGQQDPGDRPRAGAGAPQPKGRSGKRSAGSGRAREPKPSGGTATRIPADVREAYAALELPLGAGKDEVVKARRTLLRRYHPDKHQADPERQKVATELTARIGQAYQVVNTWLDGRKSG